MKEGPLKSGNRRAAANSPAGNRLVCKEQMKSFNLHLDPRHCAHISDEKAANVGPEEYFQEMTRLKNIEIEILDSNTPINISQTTS